MSKEIEALYEENSINVNKEIDLVLSIANSLRGPYKADKYKDVIIPMIILRRLECALAKTKKDVVEAYEKNNNTPIDVLKKKAGFDFYNTSKFDLKELLNDSTNLADNFKSYIEGFSSNVQDMFGKEKGLDFYPQIDKMDKNNRLYSVVKKFSALDLDPEKVDAHKMGYMFEDIIRRFSENDEAGDHYTPREVIRLMVNILLSEGCKDLLEDGKVITCLDMACGTGGMLSTTQSFIKHINDKVDVRLFGQEVNPESYAICLADMLIKGQNIENIAFEDTIKKDAFENQSMRFVIANPPFGTAWGGKDAPEGEEKAARAENKQGGRFEAGLPGTGDAQLLFMQHAINKMADSVGRAAIISNGSPLFSGGTSSGESQIRRMMLEKDLVEAIIALPTDLFYNTNIGIYVWILSKNKRLERQNKIQLINATSEKFWKPLRKSLGKKRKEISVDQIKEISKLYKEFKENKYCKIFDKEEFLYREYAIYQPLQRNYAITEERIENSMNNGFLLSLYDQNKVDDLELLDPIPDKEKKDLDKLKANKPTYDKIINLLKSNVNDKIYKSEKEFIPVITKVLEGMERKYIEKIIDDLSEMDKEAEIHKDKKGEIIWDKSTKDTEIVKLNKNIEEYMKEEVLPHVPDAHYEFEENLATKQPVIKTGAEIPFTRYFYEYKEPEKADELFKEFKKIENGLSIKIKTLLEEV